MNNRITWHKPDGSWGIDGVDLSTLPPRVYGALCKLLQMENLIEIIQNLESSDNEVELATEELLGVSHG